MFYLLDQAFTHGDSPRQNRLELLLIILVSISVVGCRPTEVSSRFDYVLVFHAGTDENHGIYLADAHGRAIQRVTDETMIAYSPVWSPDGTRVAFVGQLRQDKNAALSIYVLDPTTLKTERLTDPQQVVVRNGLTWSPDSKSIAFARVPLATEDWQLYSVSVEDKRLTHIVDGIVLPRWSPDGRWIAGASGDSICLVLISDKSKKYFDLAVINEMQVSSNQTAKAMPRATAIDYPFWFSDGTRVGFTVTTEKGHGIYSMKLDGTDIQELLSPVPLALCDLSWVPETSQIIMARCAEQAHGLYSLQSGASDLVPLNYDMWADSPSWRSSHK